MLSVALVAGKIMLCEGHHRVYALNEGARLSAIRERFRKLSKEQQVAIRLRYGKDLEQWDEDRE